MSTEFPTLAAILSEVIGDAIVDCNQLREGIGGPSTADIINRYAEAASDAWREACTIRTVEQLDALPDESVIRRSGFFPRTLEREGRYWHSPGDEMGDTAGADMLPALLVWHPEWARS